MKEKIASLNSTAKSGALEKAEPLSRAEVAQAFDIENYIPFQLVISELLMHRVIRPENNPEVTVHASMSQGECRILVLIFLQKANSPTETTKVLRLDRAVITRHITSLVKKKLIETQKNSDDLRRKTLCVTKSGAEVANKIVTIMSKFSQYLDNSITKAEKKTLLKTLSKLNASCLNYPPDTNTIFNDFIEHRQRH